MKLRLSFLFLILSAAACFVLFTGPRHFRAQTAKATAPPCCGPKHAVGPREVDFPYYNLTNGWISTLNLVSDSPKPLDFTLAVKGKLGQVLTTAQTITPRAKLAIDLSSLITQLGGDPTGAFAEGSVAVYFTGTIMPLLGQITIQNPQLSMVHESVMVEHDPGRSDIPAVLHGVWWGLGGREARVMVSNTSTQAQTAQVYLDFQGQRHAMDAPLKFLPYETKTLDIAPMLASLGVSPAQAPEGGITIIPDGAQPTLIAAGRITNAATGFSTTMDFLSPDLEHASSLHAAGLPVGTPTEDSPYAGAGTFVPHVIVRNLVSSPQNVSITVEYPKAAADVGAQGLAPSPSSSAQTKGKVTPAPPVPGDSEHHPEWGKGTGTTVGSVTVGPFLVGPYTSVDYSLASAISQLPLPLPHCSIRIQYSGVPGSMQAQVTSVESRSNLVVDGHVQNEGNGWTGSGVNPWHLDDDTESILFLNNESDKPARMAFSVTANDVHYSLTQLRLAPHETRLVDLRKLRDAQVPDFKKNLIPATATDGSVAWLRLDNVPVVGRLMVIHRRAGMASNYDCSSCYCPGDFTYAYFDDYTFNDMSPTISPSQATTTVGYGAGFTLTGNFQDCNGYNYNYGVTYDSNSPYDYTTWDTDDHSVGVFNSPGDATAVGAGTTTVIATYTGPTDWYFTGVGCTCDLAATVHAYATLNVTSLAVSNISPAQGLVGTAVSVTITGSGFASGATINAGSNISVSTVSVSSSTQMTATFTPTNSTSAGGNQSVTVTVNGVTSNSKNFYNQVPSKLVRLNVSGAPNGVGDLHVLTDGDVINLANIVVGQHECGVYRNYAFDLRDQQNSPQSIDGTYTITAHFTNYQGPLTTPPDNSEDITPGSVISDTQFFGKGAPSCPGANDHESFDMSHFVTIGTTRYDLSTIIHISKGYYSGTPAVDSSITTP